MRALVSSIVLLGLLAQPALAAGFKLGAHDSAAVVSPDHKRVVFLRSVGGAALKDCSASLSDSKPVELWSANADGSGAKKLLAVHAAKEVKNAICAFDNRQFSSNGQLLYFETPAWATSGAVHVYDFKNGKEHFVTDGDGLEVLSTCTNTQYADTLLVTKHKYFVFGGSYDWLWLVSPAGKEIGPVGENDGAAKDDCS